MKVTFIQMSRLPYVTSFKTYPYSYFFSPLWSNKLNKEITLYISEINNFIYLKYKYNTILPLYKGTLNIFNSHISHMLPEWVMIEFLLSEDLASINIVLIYFNDTYWFWNISFMTWYLISMYFTFTNNLSLSVKNFR